MYNYKLFCFFTKGAMAVGPRSQDTTMQRVVDMGHGNMSMKASLDTYHPVPWAGGGGIECKGGFKVHN